MKYAVNPSSREAFSIFVAEALAMGVPAIVSREIAENLNASGSLFTDDLLVENRATTPHGGVLWRST
ncbi:hypothetical protein ACSU1N_02260 [Thermogladius sp. 4427co]|uniref:hypothetical protein n=1 Tax=Thermogladius sp. 4427co TaxID=3450718 RepID=UPI003F79AB4A